MELVNIYKYINIYLLPLAITDQGLLLRGINSHVLICVDKTVPDYSDKWLQVLAVGLEEQLEPVCLPAKVKRFGGVCVNHQQHLQGPEGLLRQIEFKMWSRTTL